MLDDLLSDPLVVASDPLAGIYDQQGQIHPRQRSAGPKEREVFERIFDLNLSPHAGGVDDAELLLAFAGRYSQV